MKNFYSFLGAFIVFAIITLSFNANAQTASFDHVYNILSTKCAGSGCHSGSIPSFDVTDSKADLHADLLGEVLNPAAAGRKNRTVMPGYPSKSFLLRKVAHGLGSYKSSDLDLHSDEGTIMPQGRPNLTPVEVEIIRQWIIAGASLTENYPTVDTTRISTYYNVGGRPFMQQPAPPPPGEGFQIHMGPIFFAPGEESEFFLKHDLFLDEDIEVTGLDLKMNDESHHFILRKFKPGKKDQWADGLEPLNALTAFDSDKDYVMAWQNDEAFFLPDSTAYFWDTSAALDLNFHMFNYNNTQILPGEVYLNVYTQPSGVAVKEMKSVLINNAGIFLQPNSTETLSQNYNIQNKSIWTLAPHTHSRGTNYMVYLRKAGGGEEELYNGFIDYRTGNNAGFYDWEHPSTRFWDDFNTQLTEKDSAGNYKYLGLRHEASYDNQENRLITFGFTTEDEMMIIYVQYVDGYFKSQGGGSTNPNDTTTTPTDTITDPTDTLSSIAAIENSVNYLSVYPNPFVDEANISFGLSEESKVTIEVYDLVGKRIDAIAENATMQAGDYNLSVTGKALEETGVYLLRFTVNGETTTKKLVKTK